MKYALGHIPDSPKLDTDDPDRLFEEHDFATSAVSTSASTRKLVVEVLDQKQLGSCVIHSVFQNLRCGHMRQLLAKAELPSDISWVYANPPALGSREMGYYISRIPMGTTMEDSGTELRILFEMLNKVGFCYEKFFPYSDSQDPMKLVNGVWVSNPGGKLAPYQTLPTSQAFQQSFDQKTPTVYRRLTSTGSKLVDDVKRCIQNDFPVSFGTQVSENFCEGKGIDKPIDPPTGLKLAGGHSMLITDFNGDVFGILNSWGNFGDNGYIYFNADYIAWKQTSDLWTVEHAPVEGELGVAA